MALHKRPNKGLLAGMYELPNAEGYLSEEEALEHIKAQGYIPVRIQPVCEAKHIFSHVEWHMKGYVVFLQAKEFQKDEVSSPHQRDARGVQQVSEACREKEAWIFVDVEDTKENYAIPSAFVKYTEYLNMTIGKDAVGKN